MNIIFLLIPLSLMLLGLGVAAFFWAVKHEQFDDLEGPAYSIFREDFPTAPKPPKTKRGERAKQ